MANRRERFREYMARLNAAAHPREAIRDGLYVPSPGRSVADQVVARVELAPTSSHLVVGGVGSGKTTQLLVTRDRLREIPDIKSFYLDVSQRHDLAKLQAGVLLVLAGLALSKVLEERTSKETKQATRFFERVAHGWTEWVEPPDFDDHEARFDDYEPEDSEPDVTVPVRHKGVLIPPHPPLQQEIEEKAGHLKKLHDELAPGTPHIVFLFDSLDRVTNLRTFAEVVEQDVRAIRSAGLGAVVVGPLRVMFASERTVVDHFDYFYHQPAVEIEQDTAGQAFLLEVLRRRASEEILTARAAQKVVHWSGGVLRDLISIARTAGEEAYTAGSERIMTAHVDAAADAFGRTLMLGLRSDELEILQRVRAKGIFVPTSDKDLALLLTRRVLEYGPIRYAVHPTISPLLEQLAPVA